MGPEELSVEACQKLLNSVNNETDVNERLITEFMRPTPIKVWGIGLAFITLVCFCAAVGILLLPMIGKMNYNKIITWFIGLGVGSLSGTAIFQLLPEAFEIEDRRSLALCWTAICGIYGFYIIDSIVKIVCEMKKRLQSDQNVPEFKGYVSPLGSFTSYPPKGLIPNHEPNAVLPTTEVVTNDRDCAMAIAGDQKSQNVPSKLDELGRKNPAFCSEKKLFKFDGTIASVAWMIIFGDGFHNFIDGVSIGAAFSQNIISGISIAIAVICEEFPHELGDVAILLNSGMSPRQTLVFNLLSASTIYVGFVVGVIAGEVKDASTFVFAFAGGMFLYISLANMIPEMHEKFETTVSEDIGQGVKVFILQTSGVMVGLGCTYLLAMFGNDIDLN